MTLATNRTRSPRYPNFPLGAAVRQVAKIHAADRRNVIERLNAAKHMGYSGLSGPSEKAIGTLVQYGLLELVSKGQVRTSQLAVDILHPVTTDDHREALRKAAFNPEIFKILREQFPQGVSDATLRSYLVRHNFMDRAIVPLSKAYADTLAFLEQWGANDSRHPEPEDGSQTFSIDEYEVEPMEVAPAPKPAVAQAPTTPVAVSSFAAAMIASEEGDIKILLDGDRLRVSAFVDLKGAKRLVKALKANMALLEDDDEDDPHGVG